MKKLVLLLVFFPCLLLENTFLQAQGHITLECKDLKISSSEILKSDPISEDDPGDLSEAYGKLSAFFANYNGNDRELELTFPTRKGTYHWKQQDQKDKNDSLRAYLVYNFNPQVYGRVLQAYPKDFTISITRYDATKGGTIEGRFEGKMEAFTAWNNSNVAFPISGDFRTTRNGSAAELRKQRQAEKEVIGKAVSVCEEVVAKALHHSDWKITDKKDGRNTMIANHPAPFRPLFCDGALLELSLSVDPETNYGRMLNDSIEYYGKQSSSNPDDFKMIKQSSANLFRLQNSQHLEISVQPNCPYLKQTHPMGKNDRFTVLHIPNVPYAYQVYNAPQDDLSPAGETTWLCFGNWSGADMNAKTYVGYPFMHKKSFAAIENMVVKITGPAAAANNIIQKINWIKLNDGLE